MASQSIVWDLEESAKNAACNQIYTPSLTLPYNGC